MAFSRWRALSPCPWPRLWARPWRRVATREVWSPTRRPATTARRWTTSALGPEEPTRELPRLDSKPGRAAPQLGCKLGRFNESGRPTKDGKPSWCGYWQQHMWSPATHFVGYRPPGSIDRSLGYRSDPRTRTAQAIARQPLTSAG